MKSIDYSEKYLNADGIETRYLEAGEGSPVILIHGGGAGAESEGNWKGVIPILAENFKVYAVDMIGFGKTAKPKIEYSQQIRTKHLVSFIKALGLEGKVSLVGNSMGGATALGVCVERPELVKNLVLMGSAGLVVELHEDLKPIVNYDFTETGMYKLVEALTNDDFQIDPKMVKKRVEYALDAETREAYASTMTWIKQQGGLFYPDEYIEKVKVPTLVVQGKEDKVVPITTAYKFLDLIEDSWGYIIPNCGHWAMIEHPTDFANATELFLKLRT
ncbi:alpha/beta hydrolase [Marinobacterium iners]|uniref:alpha/beta fold hydrolase n=1 Tax=Marinobacterium iners TaxID=48076 RepID=UPI001A902C89|nr:alpha/beta hydrolase [Marinobacterium iners]QSR36198.1 alpha/beta hydrolase [Marinobacterium iners]